MEEQMSSRDDEFPVEGEPSKLFGVYIRALDGSPVNSEGRFDTYEEVIKHCRNLGKVYIIQVGRKYKV